MKKIKICVITGSRADYGIFYPVIKEMRASKNLKPYIVATCMHLMEEFGYTFKEIKKDGFDIYEMIDISYREDTGRAMADSIGKLMSSISKTFASLRPDMVLILGDRGEMLAAALAANYMNIPVAHIHGGELSGHIDGQLRHAITKLSHIHFATTAGAKKRILRLGEERRRVFLVGAPAIDRILNEKFPTENSLIEKYHIEKDEHLALLVQHPVAAEADSAARQMDITLQAIKDLKLQTIIIYPNADAGGRRMIKVIKRYETCPCISSFKNIPHKDYLGLLGMASVLIGNSSSGIIEAASFKLPVINIGTRQEGRERSINVINVSHSKGSIIKAIKKALYDKKFKKKVMRCKNIYGDGRASKRIVGVLSSIRIYKSLLQKQITY